MAEGRKVDYVLPEGKIFLRTGEKADNPMCEVHLTMMTPWDQFEENEEMVIDWFCIDCLEAHNAWRVSQGKVALSLGGVMFGKSDREFYDLKETVN